MGTLEVLRSYGEGTNTGKDGWNSRTWWSLCDVLPYRVYVQLWNCVCIYIYSVYVYLYVYVYIYIYSCSMSYIYKGSNYVCFPGWWQQFEASWIAPHLESSSNIMDIEIDRDWIWKLLWNHRSYCGWKKRCTRLDSSNRINDGMFTTYQLVIRICSIHYHPLYVGFLQVWADLQRVLHNLRCCSFLSDPRPSQWLFLSLPNRSHHLAALLPSEEVGTKPQINLPSSQDLWTKTHTIAR